MTENRGRGEKGEAMPPLLTLFLFMLSLASANKQSESSEKLVDTFEGVSSEKLVDASEGVSNAIRKSSDDLLPISRGKRSEGVVIYIVIFIPFYQMKSIRSHSKSLMSYWIESNYFEITTVFFRKGGE